MFSVLLWLALMTAGSRDSGLHPVFCVWEIWHQPKRITVWYYRFKHFFTSPPPKRKGSIGEVGSVSIALRYSHAWVNESLNMVQLSSVPLLLEHALQRRMLASTDFNLGEIILVPVSGFLFLLAYGMLSDWLLAFLHSDCDFNPILWMCVFPALLECQADDICQYWYH